MTQLPNIMWFDPLLQPGTDELRLTVSQLRGLLLRHELDTRTRKRARTAADEEKFGAAVDALACNLIVLTAINPHGVKLAVPRDHNFLRQHRSPVFGKHFLTALELLASLRLIEEGRRGYRLSARKRQPSLIWPSNALCDHLPLTPPNWRSVQQAGDQSLIILREGKDDDGRAAAIAFKETARTKRLAAQIRRINSFLREADIEITGQDDGLSLGSGGQVIAPFRRSLRRIFNNNNWQQGGRLAGAFWLNMERAARFERIRIDGERIADVDYRQLFPRLAYVRAGRPQPQTDIYSLEADGCARDGWKTLMNALLFSDGPLKNWPDDTRQYFPAGMKLRDAVSMLAARHAPIAHLFGSALGYSLLKVESDMLITTLINLFSNGTACLPVHDALLTPVSKAKIASEAMQSAFSTYTGSSCAMVTIELGTIKIGVLGSNAPSVSASGGGS